MILENGLRNGTDIPPPVMLYPLCVKIDMNKRNKNFIILSIISSAIIALIMFKIIFLSGLNLHLTQLVTKVSSNNDIENKFRIILSIVTLMEVLLSSFFCFKIAAKKKLDPWKWAKYGIFCNIFAIIYLLFIAEDNAA